jgi:2-(3-amino-3-carboxypropyl)histidine synthase
MKNQSNKTNLIQESINKSILKIIFLLKKHKPKRVLLNLPDGLKPYSKNIIDEVNKKFTNNIEFVIWSGTCFGACDIPNGIEKIKIDLLIQLGHNEFNHTKNWDN